MAVIMITHDLGVVANVAEEVVVVYHGEVMERGPVRDIFSVNRDTLIPGLCCRRFRISTRVVTGVSCPCREVHAEVGDYMARLRERSSQPVAGE